MITYKKPGLNAKNTGESMSDYIHEWQRPTLEGIIKQGFAEIDRKIDALCDAVEYPEYEIKMNKIPLHKIEAFRKRMNERAIASQCYNAAMQGVSLSRGNGFSGQASNNVTQSYWSGLLGVPL